MYELIADMKIANVVFQQITKWRTHVIKFWVFIFLCQLSWKAQGRHGMETIFT